MSADPTDPSSSLAAPAAPADVAPMDLPIHVRLAVWPCRGGRPWRAELRVSGTTRPLHFERPLDLVLFLTALPGGAAPGGGLR